MRIFKSNFNIDEEIKELKDRYPSDAQTLSYAKNKTVEITDAEIESASKLLDESSIISRDKQIGFINCWNYIKSRINQ